ncbi:MAG: CRISPR-associated helicase Cas3' [Pseudomonadota bacterium]|nr:CRISPR-associated helicase Cas3' [Pseudomonadota bacterium]
MSTLFSHYQPTLSLEQHIAQVQQAATFLFNQHRPWSDYPQAQRLLTAIVRCHDLGKASPAFQHYIQNPKAYRGAARSKSHAALSALLAIRWAQQQDWPALEILVLIAVVAGHHAGFRSLEALETALMPEDYDKLHQQWAQLPLPTLAALTQLNDLAGLKSIDMQTVVDDFFMDQDIEGQLHALPLNEALAWRLYTQFLFSILLEADKALLALQGDPLNRYFQSPDFDLTPQLVEQHLTQLAVTPLNTLRQQIRQRVLNQAVSANCLTLTLPTGSGKTLVAASWALATQQQVYQHTGVRPSIILVLPYLSIIDQTEHIYRQLLHHDTPYSEQLLASHSLASRQFDPEVGEQYAEFYLDTWRAEIVITTFDQFLLALFAPQNKALMRFHRLCDSLIILDEVQVLPPQLWDLVNQTLQCLTQVGQSKVLMMSATQPNLLQPATELVGDAAFIAEIYQQCQRYRISCQHRCSQTLDVFIDTLLPRVEAWIAENKRVMVTLNTRATAKKVWQALSAYFAELLPIYLISADVTPKHRLAKINAIKTGVLCLVVSTQTVEAGVDIDLDVVIRDFAPLDALIQVAGRCNRNNQRGRYGGWVEVVSLGTTQGKVYADMVYKDYLGGKRYQSTLLSVTRELLDEWSEFGEEQVLALSREYFSRLKQRMNTGSELTRQFAYWQDMEAPTRILRPQLGEQLSFIVAETEEEQELITQLQAALALDDRWEKRRALQQLAGPISALSVTVYQRSGFDPQDYAESLGPYWLLQAGFYDADSGLDLHLAEDDEVACII